MFIDEQLISEIRVIFHAEMEESLPKLLEEKLNFTDKSSEMSMLLQSAINKMIKNIPARLYFIY